jgi:hypothetical protein
MYLQTLIFWSSSVYAPEYSFCIFKLLLFVLLRCADSDYSFCIFKLLLSVLLRCQTAEYSFCGRTQKKDKQ